MGPRTFPRAHTVALQEVTLNVPPPDTSGQMGRLIPFVSPACLAVGQGLPPQGRALPALCGRPGTRLSCVTLTSP